MALTLELHILVIVALMTFLSGVIALPPLEVVPFPPLEEGAVAEMLVQMEGWAVNSS